MAYQYNQASDPGVYPYNYYSPLPTSSSGSYPMTNSLSHESYSSHGSGSTSGCSNHGSEATTVSPRELQISTRPYSKHKPSASSSQSQGVSPPVSPGEKSPAQYPCLWPNCSSKGRFKRATDLKRHVRTQHNAAQNLIDCKHRWCGRTGERAFTRTDHYRDHLREVHREDLPKVQVRRTRGPNETFATTER